MSWCPRCPIFYLLLSLLVAASLSTAGCEDCSDCVTEKCADLVEFCSMDPDCECMADCLGREGVDGIGGCLSSCGLEERPSRFLPVEECVAVACPDSDECSTPGDWEPPSSPPVDLGDIAGGDLPDCSFDTTLEFRAEGDVLQLQNAEETVCVRLERLNMGSGSLANTEWLLLDISVGPLDGVAFVDDPGDLCWYSSHHNFSDWAHVWTGRRLHGLHLHEDGHGGARTYELYTYETGGLDTSSCPPWSDGTNLLGVVELFPVNP